MNNHQRDKKDRFFDFILIIVAIFLLLSSINQEQIREREREQLSQQIIQEITKSLSIESDKLSENIVKKIIQEIESGEEISEDFIDKLTKEAIEQITQNLPKLPILPDYDSLKNLKHIILVQNFESWTPNAKKVDSMVSKTIFHESGKLSRAYLSIKASINEKPLSKWESIYITMNNIGGHMFRPNSLPVPQNITTELLYSLSDISYLPSIPYSETRTPYSANWFSFFEHDKNFEITAFISSLRPAKIEEISIYYDCVTGSTCLLSNINN